MARRLPAMPTTGDREAALLEAATAARREADERAARDALTIDALRAERHQLALKVTHLEAQLASAARHLALLEAAGDSVRGRTLPPYAPIKL